jgi:hypothetical protein
VAGFWGFAGGACLTAGTTATPATSIPACGSNAPLDANGSGALQLTSPAKHQAGMVVDKTALSTAGGLNDDVHGCRVQRDESRRRRHGDVLHRTPHRRRRSPPARAGGSLGYGDGGAAGLANAYLGIGFDEYGNFSSTTAGSGGSGLRCASRSPCAAPRRPATRILSGYLNSGGDGGEPAVFARSADGTTRPANAPTIDVRPDARGPADRLDRSSRRQRLRAVLFATIVGVNGQPALPASVYVGFSAGTGRLYKRHQVEGFSVVAGTITSSPTPTPPSTPPSAAFSPPAIPICRPGTTPRIRAASTQSNGGLVSAWNDLSGNNNTVAQATASLEPGYTAAGIDNRGSLTFNGAAYLVGTNAAFSTSLFNASTVFVVSNHPTPRKASSVGWSGAYLSDPRWNLRLSEAASRAPSISTTKKRVSSRRRRDERSGDLDGRRQRRGRRPIPAQGRKHAVQLDGAGSHGDRQLSARRRSDRKARGKSPISTRASSANCSCTTACSRRAETASVEGYLACKWGLQNRLPANHPYRHDLPAGRYARCRCRIPRRPPGALSDPLQLRSQNGQLVFNVVASQIQCGAPQLTYNGSSVPPTLRLLPGDTLIVNLTNHLPAPPAGSRLPQRYEPALSRLARQPECARRRFDRHDRDARAIAAVPDRDPGRSSDRSLLVPLARAR